MSQKCPRCTKTIYPNDPQLAANDSKYHKACFACVSCKARVELTTYKSHQNEIYCARCVPTEKPKYGPGSLESARTSSAEKLKREASAGADLRMKEQKYTLPVDSVDVQRVKDAEATKRVAGAIVRGEDKLKGDNKYTISTDSVDLARAKDAEETKRLAGGIVRGEDKLKGDNKYTYRLSGVEYTRVKGNETTKQDTFLVGGRENDRLLGDNAYTPDTQSLELERVRQNEANKDLLVNPNDRLHAQRED